MLILISYLMTQLIASAGPAGAPADPPAANTGAISIRLMPNVVLESQDIRATVQVPPEAVNRMLAVALDAGSFYSSTERQLEGANAARTFEFNYHGLPAGEYVFSVRVLEQDGSQRSAQKRFSVHGRPADDDISPRR